MQKSAGTVTPLHIDGKMAVRTDFPLYISLISSNISQILKETDQTKSLLSLKYISKQMLANLYFSMMIFIFMVD